jgi:hypothetical protein
MKRLSRIPTMNLPDESGTYNIIQFYIDDRPYLRFGSNLEKKMSIDSYQGSHEQIISRFCEEIYASPSVDKIGNGKPRPRDVAVLPSKSNDSIDCILIGAGTCKLYEPSVGMKDPITPPATFYGKSISYNRMICSYHLFEMRDEFKKNGIDFDMFDIKYD